MHLSLFFYGLNIVYYRRCFVPISIPIAALADLFHFPSRVYNYYRLPKWQVQYTES